jgi:hypothetical protein
MVVGEEMLMKGVLFMVVVLPVALAGALAAGIVVGAGIVTGCGWTWDSVEVVGGPPPIMELIIEPSNEPADVFYATGGGGTDIDKVKVDVEGR